MRQLLSKIPSINNILLEYSVKQLVVDHPEKLVKDVVKNEVEKIKNEILKENLKEVPSMDEIIEKIKKEVKEKDNFSLRRVINATGTILHTNLGRSMLSECVKENLMNTLFNYTNLEFDIEQKARGTRCSHLESIIKKLTGAEDVLVVNNNAAAVMLVLNTLARDREIVVSRGELVEIGGSFRIPEIIKLSGGILCEIGTTNKTHLKDYANAINEKTAALFKVHTSNYKIVGFSKEVSNKEVVNLAHENNIIAISDLGSGQFLDLRPYGLTYEPTVKEVIDSGMDIVMFSGDKLLGGPQAGIIVGKKKYIEEMKKNQLTRALRVDKMTIAALEATLRLCLDEKKVFEDIPTLNMISISKDVLMKKANKFVDMIKTMEFYLEIAEDKSEIGGGSFPETFLDSIVVKLTHKKKSSTEIERRLLLDVEVPVITRIKENSIILDMRTLRENEFELVKENLIKATK